MDLYSFANPVRALTMNGIATKPRLLIIDDDRSLCELLSVWLSDRFEIATGYDGEQGIDLAAKHRPDLILLDVMMPKLSGFSLAWVFKHDPRYRGSAVIFITAIELNRRSLGQADEHLRKPFTRRELTAVIDKVLLARRVAAPAAAVGNDEELSDGHRRAPRVNVDLPATYEVGGAVVQGSIRCLSPWGAFFATGEALPTDRAGRVRFADDGASFELDSYPIYQSRHEGRDGVGLRLRASEHDQESRLYQLIEKPPPAWRPPRWRRRLRPPRRLPRPRRRRQPPPPRRHP
jgi:CheY-like chemotaxis protein